MYLSSIARNYIDIYRKKNNIKAAELVTAFIPDDNLKKETLKILEEQFKSRIDLKTDTNKDIIGGFVLTVDGLQYDASVTEKLKDVKKKMLSAE